MYKKRVSGRSRDRFLLLLLPCLPLADRAHPLNATPGQNRRKWVREAEEMPESRGTPSQIRRERVPNPNPLHR